MSAAWEDLRTRVFSAVVMVILGAVAIWVGGPVFTTLAALVAGIILWEVALMTRVSKTTAYALGGVGIVSVLAAKQLGAPLDLGILLLPSALGLIVSEKPGLYAVFAAEVVLGSYALSAVMDLGGVVWVLFILAIVAASDTLGYFAGRTFGGPKLWPLVSPKKTWSGTVAGWLGAILVGVGFALYTGVAMPTLIAIALILSVAGQAGDIAESALKRICGVKDSSALIPGHGGFFDRFDALLGACVVVWVIISFGSPWW